jgi:hypothetical protein
MEKNWFIKRPVLEGKMKLMIDQMPLMSSFDKANDFCLE